jgi:Na+/proline symporter
MAVGLFFVRRAGKSTSEFFISGRTLPWWLAGTSMVATSFAADTPLVVSGWVRDQGISFNWLWWSFAIGGMFSVFLLSRLWRRAEVVTDVELSELRYGGRPAAVLRAARGAYMAIPVNCITLAWVILAMTKLMKILLGIDPVLSVAICLVLTVSYAVLSGFWGVVVTDLLQFVLAMAGAIGLCVVTVSRLGGLAALRARAEAASPMGERLTHFFPRPPAGTGPLQAEFWSGPIFAFAVFIFVQWWANKNADGGGVVIQRMSATKNERHSLLATLWFNIANYALRPWPWILVALGSIVLFPKVSGEDAYPLMIRELAGPGLMGVMVASFLGAFMSTVDTHLNLSAAYIVNDVYRRMIRRDASERHYVLVSRIASVGFVLLAGGIALASNSISGLFQFLLAFTSGFGIVLILRWFWWRINAWSELSAMIASGVIASGLYVLKGHAFAWMTKQHILAITVAGSTVVWLTVTFLTAPVAEEKLLAFYRKVRPYGAWGRIAAASGVTPPKGLGRMLASWLAGSVMVLAATFAAGKFLLASPGEGCVYLVLAAGGAVVVWLDLRRQPEVPAAGG